MFLIVGETGAHEGKTHKGSRRTCKQALPTQELSSGTSCCEVTVLTATTLCWFGDLPLFNKWDVFNSPPLLLKAHVGLSRPRLDPASSGLTLKSLTMVPASEQIV